MMMFIVALILCVQLASTLQYSPLKVMRFTTHAKTPREMSLFSVPMELQGQLDPKRSWPVRFILNGVEKVINVPEGTSFLMATEKVFKDVESSCRNGVCTTCAAKVRK
jgi:ferredoxin